MDSAIEAVAGFKALLGKRPAASFILLLTPLAGI